jgi:hypothetical protein
VAYGGIIVIEPQKHGPKFSPVYPMVIFMKVEDLAIILPPELYNIRSIAEVKWCILRAFLHKVHPPNLNKP